MKWLMWAPKDLMKSTGGVETHVKCVMKELQNLGVHVEFSSSPEALLGNFDVIHTHGSLIDLSLEMKRWFQNSNPKSVRVQTLHGQTLDRMSACKEWVWFGGYAAAAREIASLGVSDIVFGVHENLSLLRWLKFFKVQTGICGNGWDSWDGKVAKTDKKLPEIFLTFIGRGDDFVKGATRLSKVYHQFAPFKLVAVPGEGFQGFDDVIKCGASSPAEIRKILESSHGLLLPSFYEGLPLVVLEALALGVPVLATRVGGLKGISKKIEGLVLIDDWSESTIRKHKSEFLGMSNSKAERKRRAEANRKNLMTWHQVAQNYLGPVTKIWKQKNA